MVVSVREAHYQLNELFWEAGCEEFSYQVIRPVSKNANLIRAVIWEHAQPEVLSSTGRQSVIELSSSATNSRGSFDKRLTKSREKWYHAIWRQVDWESSSATNHKQGYALISTRAELYLSSVLSRIISSLLSRSHREGAPDSLTSDSRSTSSGEIYQLILLGGR